MKQSISDENNAGRPGAREKGLSCSTSERDFQLPDDVRAGTRRMLQGADGMVALCRALTPKDFKLKGF